MKIKLSQLRRLIREVISQQAVVPGKWNPAYGEVVDPEEIGLMGTGGLGRDSTLEEEDEDCKE